jgi:epsilon-lactone hydrolase
MKGCLAPLVNARDQVHARDGIVRLANSSAQARAKRVNSNDMKARTKKIVGTGVLALGVSVAAAAGYIAVTPGQGSFTMRLAAEVIALRGKPLADTEKFRTSVLGRTQPVVAAIPAEMRTRLQVSERLVEGNRVFTLAPGSSGSRKRIVYLHGGAYVNELTKPHWDIIAKLIEATGATVIVPIYPLAPENDHRAAFAFLDSVYRQILANTAADDVVLAGDSAGAGLALGMVVDARDKGLPMPGRIILFSPWLDLTLADPHARAVEADDVMLAVDALRMCGAWWAGDDDPRLPRLSPLYADLKGLPPIELYQGTNDIFVVDSRTFVKKVQAAGGAIHYGEYPGAFHVFVGATFTPEAKYVFGRIAASGAQSPSNRP